jgi:hypothetical protein
VINYVKTDNKRFNIEQENQKKDDDKMEVDDENNVIEEETL